MRTFLASAVLWIAIANLLLLWLVVMLLSCALSWALDWLNIAVKGVRAQLGKIERSRA